MAFCPHCGTEIVVKSKFCSQCGKLLELKPETKAQRFSRNWSKAMIPLGAITLGYGIITENKINILLALGLLGYSTYDLLKNRR